MFRSRLLWRLYAGYVSIISISTLIVGTLVSQQVTENGLNEIHRSLAVRTQFLAEIAKDSLQDHSLQDQSLQDHSQQNLNSSSLQQIVVRLGNNTESRLTVIANSGKVVADSKELPMNMDNHGQRPEIIDAKANVAATISRFSQTLQQQMMYRAQQVTANQITIGFVRVSLPLSTIDEKLKQLRVIVLFGASLAAAAALILGFYVAKRFSAPLIQMTEVAEAISQGDYDKRITVRHRDEIGQLATAFNRMAKNSEQRMAEITADHKRLAMVFSGMVEGVIGVDHHQKIIHVNQAAAKLLELSMTTCLNKPIWEQVRIQEITNALEQALETREVVKTQMRRPSETDDLVVNINAAILSNEAGEVTGAVIVLHDISELDRLERIRRDFVANASHELKTPITAIRGLAETILDDADMEVDVRHSFIEKINSQSLRLSQLVTDLMTLSRLESDQNAPNEQQVDLTEIVRRSTSNVKTVCDERQLTLTVQIDQKDKISIFGDMQALSQLTDNLIDNAIKYTPSGGTITVSLKNEENEVQLSVTDTGIGISHHYQQRVFERFYRVDKARSRELGGTGLGLSIVKNIAEQHGGSISIKSQQGSGSTFRVVFPI